MSICKSSWRIRRKTGRKFCKMQQEYHRRKNRLLTLILIRGACFSEDEVQNSIYGHSELVFRTFTFLPDSNNFYYCIIKLPRINPEALLLLLQKFYKFINLPHFSRYHNVLGTMRHTLTTANAVACLTKFGNCPVIANKKISTIFAVIFITRNTWQS